MSAHTGRCSRSWRRTKIRKAKVGIRWVQPIRQKVPLVLQPFMNSNGRRAVASEMKIGFMRYIEHNSMIGRRPQSR